MRSDVPQRDEPGLRALADNAPDLDHVPAGVAVVEGPSSKGLSVISAETESQEALARANRELERQVDEFRTLLNVIPIGIGIAHDPACSRVTFNTFIDEIIGLDPGETASLVSSYGDAPPPVRFFQNGRELSLTELPLWQAAAHGVQTLNAEMNVVLPGGRKFTVIVHAAPFFDEAGKSRGGIVAIVDITQRKRAEEGQRFLAEASALLSGSLDRDAILDRLTRLAVPAIADGCTVHGLEPDGTVCVLASMHVNPHKAVLGRAMDRRYPLHASPGSAIHRVLCGGPAELYTELTDEVLERVVQSAEHRDDMRAVGYRSAMIVPLADRSGVFAAMTFFATEESDRRYSQTDMELAKDLARRAALAIENARMYRQAQEADQRKDEFLAMLAHELRNPLAPMLTGLTLIRLRTNTESFEKPLATIERQVRHLTRLVDDLFDVSRITRGKIELRKEPLDLSALVARAVDTTRPLIESRKLRLLVEPAPVGVNADPVRLEQVLVNLLNNAAKYTEPGGQIEVTCAVDGPDVLIRVTDSGVGIPADVLPHIFEPFTQAKRSLDRSQGGLGIGLTLVKQLVEMHGGRVEARSAGPGQGSEFIVRLPCLEPV